AYPEPAHAPNELSKEPLINFVRDNESLRCDTGLTGVDRARFDRSAQRRFEVCAWHHDECIAAAQLEHTFFDFTRGCACDGRSSFFAACYRYGLHARVDDQFFHLIRLDQQCLENALLESGAAKDLFNCKRALRHIRCVLKQADVAGNQSRCSKSKHLPERKIPWHHREHRSDRLILDVTFSRIGMQRFLLEESSTVFRVKPATELALLDFCD